MIWLQENENIKEYKDGYMITDHGRVYSKKSSKWLKLFSRNHKYNNYYEFKLNGETTTRVHRCVALLFIPNTDSSKNQVNHIDGNKLNNNVSNLEWVTQTENQVHSWDIGLRTMTDEHREKLRVSNQGKGSKMTEEEVRAIFNMYHDGLSHTEIAENIEMSRQHISATLSGKYWAHLNLVKDSDKHASRALVRKYPQILEVKKYMAEGNTNRAAQRMFGLTRNIINRLVNCQHCG